MPQQYFRGIRIPDYDEVYPLPLVTKSQWGASPPTGEMKKSNKLFHTIVFAFNTGMTTCTSQEECTKAVQDLQKRDLELGYPDVCYNFLLGGDGRVYEGRGWRMDHPFIYPTRYKRALVIGVIGQGRDRYKTWLPPFDTTIKILIKTGKNIEKILKKTYAVEEDRIAVLDAAYIDFVKRHYDPDQFGESKWSRKKKYLKTYFAHLESGIINERDYVPEKYYDWDGTVVPDPEKLKELDNWVVPYSDLNDDIGCIYP